MVPSFHGVQFPIPGGLHLTLSPTVTVKQRDFEWMQTFLWISQCFFWHSLEQNFALQQALQLFNLSPSPCFKQPVQISIASSVRDMAESINSQRLLMIWLGLGNPDLFRQTTDRWREEETVVEAAVALAKYYRRCRSGPSFATKRKILHFGACGFWRRRPRKNHERKHQNTDKDAKS